MRKQGMIQAVRIVRWFAHDALARMGQKKAALAIAARPDMYRIACTGGCHGTRNRLPRLFVRARILVRSLWVFLVNNIRCCRRRRHMHSDQTENQQPSLHFASSFLFSA